MAAKRKTDKHKPENQQKALAPSKEAFAGVFERMRQRANRGDRKAQAALTKYLDAHGLWDRFGDLADHAEMNLIATVSGSEWLSGQAIKRKAAKMRDELAGSSPTLLETMAVRRLVTCWLNLQHVEMQSTQTQRDLGWAKFWLKRLELAHKLYKSAEDSLIQIRQLLPSAAQAPVAAPVESPAHVQEAIGKSTGPTANGKPKTKAAVERPAIVGTNRIAGRLNGHNGRVGPYLKHVAAEA